MQSNRLIATVVALTFLGGVGLSACSSNDGLPSATSVIVSEWIVQPKPSEVKAGDVKITATNPGGGVHELLVYRGHRSELPLKANGSVDEDAAMDRIIGEIEDIGPGMSKSKTFDLRLVDAYTLFCNIVHDTATGVVNHFAKGMVSDFTVSYSK